MRAVKPLLLVVVCAASLHAQFLVRQPYLQNVRPDGATVVWAMLENASGTVQFSSDRSFSRSAAARVRPFTPAETGIPFTFYQYQADLTNLAAGTEYYYRITLNGQNLLPGEDLRFRAARTGSGGFTFLAIGDSGDGTPAQFEIANRLKSEPAAFLVHTGDIAYPNGTFQEFQSFYFDVYSELMKKIPFFPSPGNHEYWRNGSPSNPTNNGAPYVAVHVVPGDGVRPSDQGRYYSYDWGNAHFISLDSNIPLQDVARGDRSMLDWLEQDLQRTRAFWRIAYFHHPPFATGPNRNDPLSALARQYLAPILERYGVQFVLNGHEHSYQRSFPLRNGTVADNGTVYMVTGGGGHRNIYGTDPSPLLDARASVYHYVRIDVQGSRLTTHTIRIDGTEIDSTTIAPAPVMADGACVNAASFTQAVAPGALVSIFGRNIAAGDSSARSLPLPTELSGISVSVDGRRIPLLFVSPTQVNAQLPFNVRGRVSLQVSTPNGSSSTTIDVVDLAPAIFSMRTESGVLPTVVRADGSFVSTTSPARPGEAISIFMTGLGEVNGTVAAGQAAPANPPMRARIPVDVVIDNTAVTPSYAGLAPGFAGLYQVNAVLPAGLPPGTHTLRVGYGSIFSNSVNLEIR